MARRSAELTSSALALTAAKRADQHWHRGGFYRRLNNMLFRATDPSDRYKILAKFYEHDPGLIARFYAGELHTLDPRLPRRKPRDQVNRRIARILHTVSLLLLTRDALKSRTSGPASDAQSPGREDLASCQTPCRALLVEPARE